VLTDQLYRDHGRLVGGLCRALLRDRAEAEDAAQQVFLAAHRALLHGTSPREPAAWLAAIARNECWARIRLRMREPLPRDDVDDVRSVSDPLAEAIRNADLAAMWIAIAELPRLQRDALLLREFGGLSYEELAGALAVSGSAVESLLFRARQSMRARLRTAYAGVAGASWLDSLGRLVGGIGGGMAPVAAKVAAVGVGAAVATGGAVVAPRMLEHRQQNSPLSHLANTTARLQANPVKASRPVPVLVARTRPAQAAQTVRPATHERDGKGSGGEGRSRDVDPVAGGDDDHSGRGRGGAGVASGSDDSSALRDASRSGNHRSGRREDALEDGHDDDSSGSDGRASGKDDGSSTGGEVPSSSGGGSGRDGSSDGGASDDHGSGGHGSDGSGSDGSGSGEAGSNDGGVLTTTSNSVVTVTASTVGNAPAGGGPQPVVGG